MRGAAQDEGGVSIMNKGGSTDRGSGMDKRCITDERTAAGGGGVSLTSLFVPHSQDACISTLIPCKNRMHLHIVNCQMLDRMTNGGLNTYYHIPSMICLKLEAFQVTIGLQ